MQLIPDWAPNVHPLFVHFPIALLFTAVAVDFLALVLRRWRWLRPAAAALYVIAGISTLVTYLTGRAAADSVSPPAEAQTILTEHADLAWWTLWFFGIYALVRLGVALSKKTRERVAVHLLLFLIALGGLYLPWTTGEHGAMMVYRYGVGVNAERIDTASAAPLPTGFSTRQNGGWRWQIAAGAPRVLRQHFRWLAGTADALSPSVHAAGVDTALVLHPDGAPTFFVAGDSLASLQAEATLNLSDFNGAVRLAHHVQDARNYDFLEIEGDTMRLGRVHAGETQVLDESTFSSEGRLPVRVVGDGTHYRGYASDQLVVHAHADPLPPGAAGLRLDGTGTLRLRQMQVLALR